MRQYIFTIDNTTLPICQQPIFVTNWVQPLIAGQQFDIPCVIKISSNTQFKTFFCCSQEYTDVVLIADLDYVYFFQGNLIQIILRHIFLTSLNPCLVPFHLQIQYISIILIQVCRTNSVTILIQEIVQTKLFRVRNIFISQGLTPFLTESKRPRCPQFQLPLSIKLLNFIIPIKSCFQTFERFFSQVMDSS